ncbi:MAG: glutamate-1-semialdehyde 2,1-aminomutase [Nitrospinae bacterium]|nr:glutamate-1-semialdehyde 2,1-aminomutase [Nitrospinota bacterium]
MGSSKELFEVAKRYIPGGVNSPVRAFMAVGGDPIFIKRGAGSKIYDVDGKEYIDYVGSWGPMIIGHAHPRVVSALQEIMKNGTSFGAPTELEIELARLIVESVPSVEKVRMVNSGTEAVMSAIRLARGYTGRDKIVKFEGCYHGHADSLLVKAGSGITTLGIPNSPGIPTDIAKNTITLPFNDLERVEEVLKIEGEDIACVILEPIAGNMGVIPPVEGFLETLRRLTEEYSVLLIFDEVITGFRVAYGGAQEIYNIIPDLTCLGKIIGGGLPVGAYGGKREIMERIAPSGPVYQAGTLSGNPLAMIAGIETLKILSEQGVYDELEQKTNRLCQGLEENARRGRVPISLNRVGSMFSIFFTDREVRDYASAKTSDTGRFAKYFSSMLQEGIYLAPSQFESAFVSTAHSDEDIDRSISAGDKAFQALRTWE